MSKKTEINVLYEDPNIVAINKPAGLLVHRDAKSGGPFLTDWILEKYPEAIDIGEPARNPEGVEIARPGIVHRLDRETSGVLLIAKTKKGFETLKKQFAGRSIKKKYIAFVWGELKEEFGTITRPIGRNNSDFRKWSAQRGARGEMRDAETYWTKIKNFKSEVKNENGQTVDEKFTFVEAEPKTGRTHQIRVHLAAIHHPVVGDNLYAPKRPQALGFERTALHALYLDFENSEGKRIVVEAPLPEDFKKAIKNIGIKFPR